MGQKKFEKRLQKKQFYKKMIRMSETAEIQKTRKEADEIRLQISKSKDNLNDLFEQYTEINSRLTSLPEKNPDVLHLLNYFEIFVTPKILSYSSNCGKKISNREYHEYLIDFRNLNNEIKRVEDKLPSIEDKLNH